MSFLSAKYSFHSSLSISGCQESVKGLFMPLTLETNKSKNEGKMVSRQLINVLTIARLKTEQNHQMSWKHFVRSNAARDSFHLDLYRYFLNC